MRSLSLGAISEQRSSLTFILIAKTALRDLLGEPALHQ
jgi:hypothetical protein